MIGGDNCPTCKLLQTECTCCPKCGNSRAACADGDSCQYPEIPQTVVPPATSPPPPATSLAAKPSTSKNNPYQ